MSPPLDTDQIRRAFGRAARSYARHSSLQRGIEDRLLERLEYVRTPPQRILDVGCGPGRASSLMRKRWKGARVIALDLAMPMLQRVRPGWRRPLRRVCADARAMPLPDASIDVLFSNLCIQWIDDLPRVFDEFRRVLRPGGYLAVSTFGPETLYELRTAWAAADEERHVSSFADIARVGDALVAAGLRDPVLDRDSLTVHHPDASSVMRELKAIGATNADTQRPRGLTGRMRFRRVLDAYERFRTPQGLPATYEVISAHAWGAEPGQPRRDEAGEIASFPIERLRGSRRRDRK